MLTNCAVAMVKGHHCHCQHTRAVLGPQHQSRGNCTTTTSDLCLLQRTTRVRWKIQLRGSRIIQVTTGHGQQGALVLHAVARGGPPGRCGGWRITNLRDQFECLGQELRPTLSLRFLCSTPWARLDGPGAGQRTHGRQCDGQLKHPKKGSRVNLFRANPPCLF